MTREEAIERFENVKANALVQKASGVSEYWQNEIDGTIEAYDMAIEALSQPIVAKHFDIQSGYIYCSPQIAENVKVVVLCKDCKWYKLTDHNETEVCTNKQWDISMAVYPIISADDFCSYGERREP